MLVESRIRRALVSTVEGDLPGGITIGAAVSNNGDATPAALINAADRALTRCKLEQPGSFRVVLI